MYNSYNQFVANKIEMFILSKIGLTFLIVWAFFEASFWFIAPDFLLIIYSCLKPEKYKKFVLYALASSFIGGVVYYFLNIWFPIFTENTLKSTPFVSPRMFEYINNTYTENGYLGVLYQSFSFMAFKIWTHLAIQHNFSPFYFFPLVIISRFFRLFIVSFITAFVGKRIHNFVKKHVLIWLITYSGLFLWMLVVVEN